GQGTEIERTQITESVTLDEKGQPKKSHARVVIRETKQLVSPAQLLGMPSVNAADGVGPNGFANTDQGSVYKFHYLFSAMPHDLPAVGPFVAKPFDAASLTLQVPERHRSKPDDPDGNAKPSRRTRSPKQPKQLKLSVVEKEKNDDDDDLPYRSK